MFVEREFSFSALRDICPKKRSEKSRDTRIVSRNIYLVSCFKLGKGGVRVLCVSVLEFFDPVILISVKSVTRVSKKFYSFEP